jgi:hypothetical protein
MLCTVFSGTLGEVVGLVKRIVYRPMSTRGMGLMDVETRKVSCCMKPPVKQLLYELTWIA